MKIIKDVINSQAKAYAHFQIKRQRNAFIKALKKGDQITFEQLLQTQAELIFSREVIWETHPFYLIHKQGNKKMMEFYSQSPYLEMSQLNTRDYAGKTAFHYLMTHPFEKRQDMLDKLLQIKGLNVDVQDSYGFSPVSILLTTSLTPELTKMAQSLVDYGADLSFFYYNHREQGLLLHCVEYERLNSVQFLIDNGANLTQKNEDGTQPFDMALERGNLDIINLFLQNKEHFEEFKNMILNYDVSLSVRKENILSLQRSLHPEGHFISPVSKLTEGTDIIVKKPEFNLLKKLSPTIKIQSSKEDFKLLSPSIAEKLMDICQTLQKLNQSSEKMELEQQWSLNNIKDKVISDLLERYFLIDEKYRTTLKNVQGHTASELLENSLQELQEKLSTMMENKNQILLDNLAHKTRYVKQIKTL